MLKRLVFILLLLSSVSVFAQDPIDYDRILIPLTTTTPERGPVHGANGSLWETTLTIHNRHDAPLDFEGPVCDPFFIADPPPGPCWDSRVDPHVSERAAVYSSRPDFDTGAFLHVIGNANFERVPMTLRVRDISQNAQSFGTNIPTPHYSDFLQHVILTDVPTDAKYRATLRIYSADEAPRRVTVRVFTLGGVTPIEETSVEMIGKVILVFDPTPDHPAFAQLDPLSAAVRAAGPSVRIEIEDPQRHIVSPPPPPLWAMVSITNNETQQVTIIDP